MEITTKINEVRSHVARARAANKTIGLVPTMGALHAGHVSLINAAVEKCDYVVVSIFVNPTQFGPGEDLDNYPRDLTADSEICKNAGVELIFAPGVNEMYPDRNLTWVTVDDLTAGLCGSSRPAHFRGVTTVCTKLFNIVAADIAFFGQKDAQQAIVIKRMVEDTNLPLKIEICPTIRENDGLAMSSRNKYLTTDQRKDAILLYKALKKAGNLIAQGTFDSDSLIAAMKNVIDSSFIVDIEYVSIVDAQTLSEVKRIENKALIAVAARLGKTRLIDNIIVDLNKP